MSSSILEKSAVASKNSRSSDSFQEPKSLMSAAFVSAGKGEQSSRSLAFPAECVQTLRPRCENGMGYPSICFSRAGPDLFLCRHPPCPASRGPFPLQTRSACSARTFSIARSRSKSICSSPDRSVATRTFALLRLILSWMTLSILAEVGRHIEVEAGRELGHFGFGPAHLEFRVVLLEQYQL